MESTTPVTKLAITPYEKRLLKLIVEGRSYTTAAEQPGAEYSTDKFYMQNIYESSRFIHNPKRSLRR